MSKSDILIGCLSPDHTAVDCEEAGVKNPNHMCASCWAQRIPEWSADEARERVRRDMITDASDAGDEEEQIEAGLAWLQELWVERRVR